jgi:hypothetical protein
MQDMLRLMILTTIGVVITWFIVMTVDTHAFLQADIDPTVSGIIPMNRTDIGAQCGEEYENSNHVVTYKLNSKNQIVYLCPLGIWPIRNTVVAVNLTDQFRKTLTPAALQKINATYAPEPAAASVNPTSQPAAAGSATPAMNANAPAYVPPTQNSNTNPSEPGSTVPAYAAPATPGHP